MRCQKLLADKPKNLSESSSLWWKENYISESMDAKSRMRLLLSEMSRSRSDGLECLSRPHCAAHCGMDLNPTNEYSRGSFVYLGSYKCLKKWMKKAWLQCWPSRISQVSHQRCISGIHCAQVTKHTSGRSTLTLKPRPYVTRRLFVSCVSTALW